MEEKYKGYQIEYFEDRQVFTVKIGNSFYQNSVFSSVKKYIDRLDSKDFNRVDVIVDGYQGRSNAVVTSYPEGQTTACQECWVSFKDQKQHRSRSKVNIKNVFLDNSYNQRILMQMKEKEDSIEKMIDDIHDLKKKLEIYKPDK